MPRKGSTSRVVRNIHIIVDGIDVVDDAHDEVFDEIGDAIGELGLGCGSHRLLLGHDAYSSVDSAASAAAATELLA